MDQKEKIAHKRRLKAFCIRLISDRIQFGQSVIENAQHSANQEEKSSAGDKYETSRAMNHLEKNMNARQLKENIIELSRLQEVDPEQLASYVRNGCFIKCGKIHFFIAAGLGKQHFENEDIFFLSPHAPLALSLMQEKTGFSFLFNKTQITIEEIY